MLPHPVRTREQRLAEPRAGQRKQASLDSVDQVYIAVGLCFRSRCYEFQQFKHTHFMVSSRAKNGFWTVGCFGLPVSLLYEEGHVNDQGLVKMALNVAAAWASSRRKGKFLIGNKDVSGR